MRPAIKTLTLGVVCLSLSCFAPAAAQLAPAPPRPKLVVLLVVDQMRADYVEKFGSHWTGGLRRLMTQGAWFREAAYPYLNTFTCVGHATISTSAFPATHGIISNRWWDRKAGKPVTCTADPEAKDIGYGVAADGGDTAWRLRVPTFTDELRVQGNGPTRVVTFSLKARAALMLAGHGGTAATWLNPSYQGWETSSAFGAAPFVAEFVNAHPIQNDSGKTWNLSLPPQDYFYRDDGTAEGAPPGWGTTFPHVLKGKSPDGKLDAAFYQEWAASPFSDAYLGRMAQAAVDALKLGQGNGTDFLGVSFSGLDLVGHRYGPRSFEVQDLLLRLDRTIGSLLDHLDHTVGRGNYVVALSADHGVAPIPEQMTEADYTAGDVYTSEIVPRVEKVLEQFGPERHVARMEEGDMYFEPGVYDNLLRTPAALRAVLDEIRSVAGVAEVFRKEQLRGRPLTADPLRRAAEMSYDPERSGDLIVVLKPYWIFGYGSPTKAPTGTTHGSAYGYDQRVPVFLMGWGIKPGTYMKHATPADIAPTLAYLCGITLAPRDGRVLSEALAARAARPTRRTPKLR